MELTPATPPHNTAPFQLPYKTIGLPHLEDIWAAFKRATALLVERTVLFFPVGLPQRYYLVGGCRQCKFV
jgi:hypothetical protein